MSTIIINIKESDKTFLLTLLDRMKISYQVEDKKTKSNPKDKIPNKETLRAIMEVESGVGLNKAKNSEDLFKQLGI